jgi:hypothetical protein
MPKYEGACYCGSLRYAIAGDPLNTAICHCKSCQRQTGSTFSVITSVPRGSLSMEGSVATYEITGDNGAVSRRYFCAKCGSPIAIDPATIPAVTFLSVGTLDDTSWVKPEVQLCAKALSPGSASLTRRGTSRGAWPPSTQLPQFHDERPGRLDVGDGPASSKGIAQRQ